MKINIAHLDLEKYGYVVAVANIHDKHDRSAPSHFHWTTLKCRMIIFSNSLILGSPDRQHLQVHVVFNKTGDDYDKLNSLLLKFSLDQDGGIRQTTPEIFQICFQYTMNARIAPIWNTLGDNYLINNRNFLNTKGPQEGVSYAVTVDDKGTLILEIKAVKINLMNTEETFYPGEWIRVLPSLNKAMVEECYGSFPQVSKFRCYKDLRRHWKNIHGYRLPEEETSYYSIQFWRGEPLLYPKMCVIRTYPIITPTPKCLEKTIVTKFLNCFNAKMTTFFGAAICIDLFEVENDSSLVSINIYTATQAVSLCTPTQSTKYTPGERINNKK